MKRLGLLLGFFLVFSANAQSISIDIAKSLMITEPAILDDPMALSKVDQPGCTGGSCGMGPWSFGGIFSQIAGMREPGQFTEMFFRDWLTNGVANGFPVPARPKLKASLDKWCRTPAGNLDLSRAPFRLLAIVNRLDKRKPGSAGEGSFVFEMLDTDGNCKNGAIPKVTGEMSFWVNVGFAIPAPSKCDLIASTQKWRELSDLDFHDRAYKTKLLALTTKFTAKNQPHHPNGSLLDQVRTNEVSFGSWQIREHHLGGESPNPEAMSELLKSDTVKITPDESFRTTNLDILTKFVLDNKDAILSGTHDVPREIGGVKFLASTAELTGPWGIPDVDSLLRSKFSLKTCNGCHSNETGTSFNQIGLRQLGQASSLSGFLTGITVPDPFDDTPRSYNDLKSRHDDMASVLASTCESDTDNSIEFGVNAFRGD